jgi:hypothetical protein
MDSVFSIPNLEPSNGYVDQRALLKKDHFALISNDLMQGIIQFNSFRDWLRLSACSSRTYKLLREVIPGLDLTTSIIPRCSEVMKNLKGSNEKGNLIAGTFVIETFDCKNIFYNLKYIEFKRRNCAPNIDVIISQVSKSNKPRKIAVVRAGFSWRENKIVILSKLTVENHFFCHLQPNDFKVQESLNKIISSNQFVIANMPEV